MDTTIIVAIVAAAGTVIVAFVGYFGNEWAKRRELRIQVISENKRIGYVELVSTLGELVIQLQAYVYFALARVEPDARARSELVNLARAAAELPIEAAPLDGSDAAMDRHHAEITAKTYALGRRMAAAFGKAAVVSSEATLMEDDADLEDRLDGILALVDATRTDATAFTRLEAELDAFNAKVRSVAVKLGADLRRDFRLRRDRWALR